jgi:hypothetical protein
MRRFSMSLKRYVPQRRAAASSHFQRVSVRRSVMIDIFWDLVQKTLPPLEPPPQSFYETFVPLTAFQLGRRLRFWWQRWRDGQPEADKQR